MRQSLKRLRPTFAICFSCNEGFYKQSEARLFTSSWRKCVTDKRFDGSLMQKNSF